MDYEPIEPAHEVNEYSPTSLNHIVGQKHAVEQIRVALDASQMDGTTFPNSLLVGPPGVGKSQLSNIIAREMASDFTEVLGQSLKNEGDLNAILLAAKHKSVILIDEAHLLKPTLQTSLYLALDKKVIIVGNKNGKAPQRIPIFDCTILLATTDEYLLLQPLRDRCKLNLRLEFYSDTELSKLVSTRTKMLKWNLHPEVIPEIAKRAKGTPRIALRILQAARRLCRSLGEHEILDLHLTKACELERIDSLGLNHNEQRYLQFLADGDSRLNVIASRLGLPSQTVSNVVEPFLLRAELVVKDDQGRRQLTAYGREHLENGTN